MLCKPDNMQTRIPLELFFWIAALGLLAISAPQAHGHAGHFTMCPLANAGITWCPGCGIGRAITQLMHGNLQESLDHHWLGGPALLIILYRIVTLTKLVIKNKKLKYKEEKYV